jgi:hypothetical protein
MCITAEDDDGIHRIGWLEKQSKKEVGTWKNKWFMMAGHYLRYYKTIDGELRVAIDLRQVTEVRSNGEDPAIFELVMADETLMFRADDDQAAGLWIKDLQGAQREDEAAQQHAKQITVEISDISDSKDANGMRTQYSYMISQGGKSWLIKKTFSEFSDFREAIIAHVQIFMFPPKTVLAPTLNDKAMRQLCFFHFIEDVLERTLSTMDERSTALVHEFLSIPSQGESL